MSTILIKNVCKYTNTFEQLAEYEKAKQQMMNKFLHGAIGEPTPEYDFWLRQFDTVADVIDLWWFDLEEKVYKVIKNVNLTKYSNKEEHTKFIVEFFKSDRFDSTCNISIGDFLDADIRLMSGKVGLDFALTESYNTSRFQVVCEDVQFKKNDVDLSQFSHIYTIKDISEDAVEVCGVLKSVNNKVLAEKNLKLQMHLFKKSFD